MFAWSKIKNAPIARLKELEKGRGDEGMLVVGFCLLVVGC